MRADLLALTRDQLALVANKGLVNAAQRHLDASPPNLSEQDGVVEAHWSEGWVCRLPPSRPLSDATCTCPSQEDVCRHILATVLAYQANTPTETLESPIDSPQTVTDPGQLPDSYLQVIYNLEKIDWSRRRKDYDTTPEVYELVRGVRPFARLVAHGVTVRYPDPAHPTTAICSCSERKPCTHSLFAAWAFRALPSDHSAGLVETGQTLLNVPTPILNALETILADILGIGMTNESQLLSRRLEDAEKLCEQGQLTQATGLLSQLKELITRYQSGEGTFDPAEIAELIGEFGARLRGLRSKTGAVPLLYLRGLSRKQRIRDRLNLIGLGVTGAIYQKTVTLTGYLYNPEEAVIMPTRVQVNFPTHSFDHAARQVTLGGRVVQAFSVGQSANSQFARLPILSGFGEVTRRDGGWIRVGTGWTGTPQRYQWEHTIPAPYFLDDLESLMAYQRSLPPAALRLNTITANLHMIPIETIDSPIFEIATQRLIAPFKDLRGTLGIIELPYSSHATTSFEEFAVAIRDPGSLYRGGDQSARVKYLFGRVRLRGGVVYITPISLILEGSPSGERISVQPHLNYSYIPPVTHPLAEQIERRIQPDAANYPAQMLGLIGRTTLSGVGGISESLLREWVQLAEDGKGLGLVRLAEQVQALAESLLQRQHDPRWIPDESAQKALTLSIIARIGNEL